MISMIVSFAKKKWYLLLILCLYLGIKLLFSGFIPFWDGGAYYYSCIGPAVLAPFHLANFNCFGHPSFIYMFLIGMFQYFHIGSTFLLHFPITLLGGASIVAFYQIVRFLFPSEKKKNELYLLTTIYAFYPILFAASLHLNLDYGTLVFYLFFLGFLLYKKYRAALVCGIILLFTKEPAVPLYAVTCVTYGFFSFNKRRIDKSFFLLMLPLVLYGTYVAYIRIFLHQSALWTNFGMKRAAEILFIPDFTNPLFLQYLIGIFLFNFNWIFTGVICIALIYYVKHNKKTFLQSILKNKSMLFLSATFLLNLYILTSFKTFINLRYYLPLYPLLFIFFYASLLYLFRRSLVRYIFLGITLIIVLISNGVSIDPVTRFLFGTFKVGNNTFYKVGGLNDGINSGVDGLVYNFQFAAYHYILNALYADIKPTENTVFVFYNDVGDWNLLGWINNISHKKMLLEKNAGFKVRSYPVEQLLKLSPQPSRIYYVDLPSVHVDVENTSLTRFYSISSKKSYSYFGSAIEVSTLMIK